VRRRLAVAAALGLALAAGWRGPAPARAGSFWSAATEDREVEIKRRLYQREMETGDEYASLAANQQSSSADTRRLISRAVRAYENAAEARPDAAEPHFRAGNVLEAFYGECDRRAPLPCTPGHPPPAIMERIARHWTRFEELAPLDPRINQAFLFKRAIANTHVADHAHIAAALEDYKKSLRHITIGVSDRDLQTTYGNMAETYMMLGQLDHAIDTYRQALRYGSNDGTLYGLAVALDRDEQGAKAREIIKALGPKQYAEFTASVRIGQSFYVPDGEVYYYLALAEEALGRPEVAIADWNHFIQSGAHPEFAPRARANRDALAAELRHRGHHAREPRSITVRVPDARLVVP
jgi:tetratricopeptide (TPR) repeat protein